MNDLLVGYGNMGRAMGAAWKEVADVTEVVAADHTAIDWNTYPSMSELVKVRPKCDFHLVVLAVKPAMARSALGSHPADYSRATLLTIAAGVTVEALSAAAPACMAVIRAMPNTPAMLRTGCTGVYAPPRVPPAVRDRVTRLLSSVGSVYWLDSEDQIDMVTAISGSGPAYYHLFSEARADAGAALGLPLELARSLAAETAWGLRTHSISHPLISPPAQCHHFPRSLSSKTVARCAT